jgi:hypothetical protein
MSWKIVKRKMNQQDADSLEREAYSSDQILQEAKQQTPADNSPRMHKGKSTKPNQLPIRKHHKK